MAVKKVLEPDCLNSSPDFIKLQVCDFIKVI